MKKNTILYLVFCIVLVFLQNNSFPQERKKLAQTGFKFLSVTTDARISGMGEAITSVKGNSNALLYNPAVMSSFDGLFDVSFGNTSWIADIDYIYGTLAFSPFNGDYGVFGLSLVAVDYGVFNGTIVAPIDDGYIDVGGYEPKAYSIGLGYAKSLSQKFSVGGQIKYVKQSLGNNILGIDESSNPVINKYEEDAFAVDFGILYHTGFKSLDFAMSVRNFSTDRKYISENFELPLTFKMGISMNVFDLTNIDKNSHSLLVSVDASHPRDYKEQIFFGGEYTFLNTLSLRGGYSFPNDEKDISLGAGLKQKFSDFLFAIDYAYTSFGIFDNVHRISVNFNF
ncbi:MAG: hypothetical protein STSR0008_14430 [Ignavibacterium sp.]